MVAAHPHPQAFTTFLFPGQRFRSEDNLVSDLTVARLVRDRLGLMHVTLRSDDGRELSAFVEQVEAAVASGHLTPIQDQLSPDCCC